MKFRVGRDVLADAVTWVARGLPTRPLAPVLAGVMIEASDEGTVKLSAFDYEFSAQITIAAEVAEPGTVLVPGRLLADISRNLPDRPVDVVTEDRKVQVACGSSRFTLPLMAVEDYPSVPASPAISGTIAGDVFTQAVAQVSIAADRADTPLPVLTGVRVKIEGDKITLLATDRYRLAMRELTWNPEATDASHVALVPARMLSETAKALGALGSIQIHLGGGSADNGPSGLIGFEAGQRRATNRLIDGDYPKVTSIFPSSAETVSVIKTEDLVAAVKRVALVAERNTPVNLHFTDGMVAIKVESDSAEANEVVEAVLTGPDIRIAFNPQYLLDGLGVVGTTYSRLSFTVSNKPAVLSGQAELDGDADTSYRYVLMPVRSPGEPVNRSSR